MLNQESIEAVNAANFSARFRRPLYDSFCFSRIPATFSYLLTGEGKEGALPSSCFSPFQESYDLVILLVLDGFGWRFLERFIDHPFLQRFVGDGIVSKLTSQFPSTTAAHMTTLHTGYEVGKTGIYEWFQYEPLVDRIITPLPFSFADNGIPEGLRSSGVDAKQFFPFETVYQKLHEQKVESYLFQHEGIGHSTYSQAFSAGAKRIAYFNLSQGLKDLQELVGRADSQPVYAMLYFGDIDSVGHRQGIDSEEFEKTTLNCLELLEKQLLNVLGTSRKKTAVLVTADHGMVAVHPKETVYLNTALPELTSSLRTNRFGKALAPAGSCRDLFLHVRPEKMTEVAESARRLLQGKADVRIVQELMDEGLFGRVSQRFLDRVGNLVVLPYEEASVWWFEKHRFEQNFLAAHGGLTPHELETIFLFLDA